MNNLAKKRAELPKTTIIDNRKLSTSHQRLAEILQEGMAVLDVGCGTGAITRGIAETVGEKGKVIGIDNNEDMIRKANEKHSLPNLSFEVADIYALPFDSEFDIVTSARVLQWLENPTRALSSMKNTVKLNGKVLVLDYNHKKIIWKPKIPKEMEAFYSSFLKWREDAGMVNTIADHLAYLFEKIGLDNITIYPQHELVRKGEKTFESQINIWSEVAEIKGKQMVEDGYLTEEERVIAEKKYRSWTQNKGEYLSMYLLAVEGVRRN